MARWSGSTGRSQLLNGNCGFIKTFFVPSNVAHQVFSTLPVSRELGYALKKLKLLRLGDLDNVTEKDIRSVHKNTSQLIEELEDLIELARSAVAAVTAPSLTPPVGTAGALTTTQPRPTSPTQEHRLNAGSDHIFRRGRDSRRRPHRAFTSERDCWMRRSHGSARSGRPNLGGSPTRHTFITPAIGRTI